MDDPGDELHVVVEFERESEANRVFQYRRDELEAVGYSEADAVWIAQNPDIDLHAALELVTKRKCAPFVAARILL